MLRQCRLRIYDEVGIHRRVTADDTPYGSRHRGQRSERVQRLASWAAGKGHVADGDDARCRGFLDDDVSWPLFPSTAHSPTDASEDGERIGGDDENLEPVGGVTRKNNVHKQGEREDTAQHDGRYAKNLGDEAGVPERVHHPKVNVPSG